MLSRSTFLTIALIAYGGFGLAALALPERVMAAYGIVLDAASGVLTRSLAVAFIGLALPLWSARAAPGSPLLAGLLAAHALYNAINVPVVLLAVVGGTFAITGWALLALHAVFAIAFFVCWRGAAVAENA